MKRAEEAVDVMFRVWRGKEGGILALFPELEATGYGGLCVCFSHIGQHGQANLPFVIRATRPAKPKEFAELKAELEAAPYYYVLHVRQRRAAWSARRRD